MFVVCLVPNLYFLSQDESDVVFRATSGKWRAVVVEISRMHKTGRPVLVGTTSVEQSDSLSELLKEAEIPHEVRSLLSCYTVPNKNILRHSLQCMHFFSLQKIHKD